MELKVVEYNTTEYIEMIELRNAVLLEPIGLPYYEEVLEKDEESFLCACFDADQMVGCCVLTEVDENVIQLRQMAVASDKQSEGIGAKVIAFAEKVARENEYNEVMVHARRKAENFYLQNGYSFVGEEFEEVDIPHMEMKKKI